MLIGRNVDQHDFGIRQKAHQSLTRFLAPVQDDGGKGSRIATRRPKPEFSIFAARKKQHNVQAKTQHPARNA